MHSLKPVHAARTRRRLAAADKGQGLAAADIIESADDAIVGKRLDGVVFSWNAGAEQLFGYSAQEMLGQSVSKLLPADRQHEEAAIIARLRQGGRVRHFETVRQRKDGALINVSVSISPIRDATGEVIGASKIARDISELVSARRREQRLTRLLRGTARASQALAQLSQSDQLFAEFCRIAIEHGAADASYLVGVSDHRPQLLASAGLSPEQLTLLNKNPLAHPVVARGFSTARSIIANRNTLPADELLVDLVGVPMQGLADPGSLVVLPVLRAGELSGVWVLVANECDFFDEIVVETLREIVSDLSLTLANRARDLEFKGIVESAMDAIVAVDIHHRITRFNPAAELLFGWPAKAMIGQDIERLIPVHFRPGHRAMMSAFAATESAPRRMGAARPLTGLRADGTEFPLEATVSRFGTQDDLRMIVVIRDASALRQAEAARSAQAAAEAANQAKAEFLSQLSHELRTPLNAVLGFAQVMLDDRVCPLPEPHHSHANYLRTAGRHLERLISDLLDMARIETGQIRVQTTPIRLAPVVAEALDVAAPSAALGRVLLAALASPPPMTEVLADPTRLRQVLFNLVSNAIKYNRPGGRVWVEYSETPGGVCVTVADDGMGMTPEQLGRLFEPYDRLGREFSGIDGMGIGLVVSRQLVRLMAGQLEISSQPGRGTRAQLTLPSAPSLPLPSEAHRPAAAGDLAHLGGRVLSVEDNPVNQLLIQAVFNRWPLVSLQHAADGASAMVLALQQPPDLVLLDMHLPDTDGLSLLARLRSHAALKSIPVVALSANALPADVRRALDAGVQAYLTKPLDVPQLEAQVIKALAKASGLAAGGELCPP